MSQPSPRRRRPTHRLRLDQRARPWQPLRADGLERSFARAIELDEREAYIDEEGDLHLSLAGLLKTMVASRPEARDHRARCARLREIAEAHEAARVIAGLGSRADVADVLIAGLGGEALRQAHDAGDAPFLLYLDRALAQRLG